MEPERHSISGGTVHVQDPRERSVARDSLELHGAFQSPTSDAEITTVVENELSRRARDVPFDISDMIEVIIFEDGTTVATCAPYGSEMRYECVDTFGFGKGAIYVTGEAVDGFIFAFNGQRYRPDGMLDEGELRGSVRHELAHASDIIETGWTAEDGNNFRSWLDTLDAPLVAEV